MEQKELLLSHMEDLAAKAVKSCFAVSRFLTPAEKQGITSHFAGRKNITLSFDGGYEGAERTRAIFLNPDWGEYDRKDLFAALKVDVPTQETFSPSHRDILGAIMALGIERDTIGDIIEAPLAFICLPELSGYFTENLTKAGHAHITLSEIDLSELPARAENLSIKTGTVSSLRLDAVLGTAFGLSRGKAVEYIKAGRVNLNHELCLLPSKKVSEGAMLSVRGLGRAKLLECSGMSKKGRMFIKVGLYGAK